MPAFRFTSILPFLPVVAGLVLSAWRFKVHDPFGGLALGLGGMLLMVVLAVRLPASDER